MKQRELGQYKKVHEDERSATLEHPDGHKVTIAKGVLSPKMRAQLGQLPMHMYGAGEVPGLDVEKIPDEPAPAAAAPPPQDVNLDQPNPMPTGNNVLASNAAIPYAPPVQQQSSSTPSQAQGSAFSNYQIPLGPQGAQGPELASKFIQPEEYAKTFEQEQAGIRGEAAAAGQQGQAESKALGDYDKAMQGIQANYQKESADSMGEIDKALKDFNSGHIDPNRYWNNLGTGQKISTAIGLALGGIGAAYLGQENPALKFLNAQIDRDINAQATDLGKQHNLLSVYMQKYGNIRDAAAMARATQSSLLAAQIQKAAAQSRDPQARYRADQLTAPLQRQSFQSLQEMNLRRAALTGMGTGQLAPEMGVRFLVPEKDQPAVTKELQAAQSMTKAKDNVMSAFDQLSNINTVGNRLWNSIQTPKQVSAIRDPIVAGLSKETAGRYTDSDAKAVGALFPAPGDSADTINLKRARIDKLLSEKMNFPSLKQWMIPVPKSAAKQNMNVAPGYK